MKSKNKKIIIPTSDVIARKLKVLVKENESIRHKLAIAEEKLKKSHATLEKKVLERTKNLDQVRAKDEAILTSIGDGLVMVDKEGKIIYINKSFEEMLGWKAQEVIDRSMLEIIPREDKGGIRVLFKESILTQVLSGEKFIADLANPFYYIRKDKSRFPVSSIVTPVVLNGKIVGAVETFRDITKEKDIDKAKTEFVSLASHQLRTPLTDISWHTEMILKGDLGEVAPEQKKYLEAIYQGNRRMIELVNTILDVSRLELGTFKVTPSPTDVTLLAQGVLDEQKSKIERRKIVIVENFSKDVPIFITDPKLLRTIFQNLIANSVEYTPEGGKIELSISLNKERDIIEIKVSDTGYGIPKSQQDKIFTKFFRADNVRDKDTDGTGLGLYIVKSIVENASGKIWFESEEKIGTTFYVTLPLEGSKEKKSFTQPS